MAKKLPRSVALILKRFSELSEEEQLLAYEACRDYLGAGTRKVVADPVLDERAQALKVMRQVVEHYKLDDPLTLEAKQFDEAPERIRGKWRSGRVIRAFGTWRTARAAAAGATPPLTARQRAIRRQATLQRLNTDDYIEAVRQWLDSKPPEETITNYKEWVVEQNLSRKSGEIRLPAPHTIRKVLKIGWRDALRIAKGEVALESVHKRQAERRPTFSRGEHDLVSHRDIVEMTGKASATVDYLSHKPGWPTAVLIIGGKRHYLRADVEAYIADKLVPTRKLNELRSIYLASADVAYRAGLTQRQWQHKVERTPDQVPTPIAAVAGKSLWLGVEIDAWLAKERKHNGQAGKRSTEDGATEKLPDKKGR